MPVFLFIVKYWKYIASLLLLLAVFGYWKSLTMRIVSQEKQIIELKVDAKVCQGNFDVCTAANEAFKQLVDQQNGEVLKQAEANKKILARYEELSKTFKKIKSDNEDLQKKINSIPWHDLDCIDQVNACYEVLGTRP